MKVKLTVSEIEKFKLACEATDIRIEEQKQYGSKTVLLVTIKHPSQLYEAGLIQHEVSIPIPHIPDIINDETNVKSKKQ